MVRSSFLVYFSRRCERLDLVCLQQVNTKGRPMTLNTRKRPFEQLYDQSTGLTTTVPDRNKIMMESHGSGLNNQGGPYQPQLAAELFIAKFAKLWGGGQMARDKTISVL